jgi:hypothetical protein
MRLGKLGGQIGRNVQFEIFAFHGANLRKESLLNATSSTELYIIWYCILAFVWVLKLIRNKKIF